MCSEIWVGDQELTRDNNCWCPLGSDTHSAEDSAKAFQDLGRQVWAKLQEDYAQKKALSLKERNIDLSRVEIILEWKLW